LVYALGGCNKSESEPAIPKKDAAATALLRNLLSQRHISGRMGLDQKKLFLEYLDQQGGLAYTRRSLDALQAELKALAARMGVRGENSSLMELLETLKV
jgi:fusicocca-2,10(14)-diene synthase/ophiobolin F synthase